MNLRNKITGEIRNAVDIDMYTDSVYLKVSDGEFDNETIEYHSLAELNEEWEDYEEPEKYFWIDVDGFIASNDISTKDVAFETFKQNLKSIGNYFATKEEAEKAREKLKAWKRLKDRHFKFDDYDILNQTATWLVSRAYDQYENDIKLLFGGEE